MTTTTPTTVAGLLPDYEIKRLAELGMISPFYSHQVRRIGDNPIISAGLGSYGYDSMLGQEFKEVTEEQPGDAPLDPKNPNPDYFRTIRTGEPYRLKPRHFVLCHSLERFVMPPNVTGMVIGKSTYARSGLIVFCTPIEAGWPGYITYEVYNASARSMWLYPGEGIVQILFFASEPCDKPYDNGRKFFNQLEGVTLGRV